MKIIKTLFLGLLFCFGVSLPVADIAYARQDTAIVEVQKLEETGEINSPTAIKYIDKIEELTQENGVRNASFIALVFLLFIMVIGAFQQFGKQQKLFAEALKEIGTEDRSERNLDRKEFSARQKELIAAFKGDFSDLKTDIRRHLDRCPYAHGDQRQNNRSDRQEQSNA